METNYLSQVTQYLRKEIPPSIVDKIEVHPGKTGKSSVQTLQELNSGSENKKSVTSAIFTLSNKVSDAQIIETEETDITLESLAYLFVQDTSENYNPQERLSKLYVILEYLLAILNNQRWKLPYTFPTSDITAIDLYGLSYDSDKLMANEGWDPTIQAYAKDLYQTQNNEPYPKHLSLWCVSWQQKLRMGNNDTLLLSGVAVS